jgi:hypothetical protein
MTEELLAAAREEYGRVVYSHKAQEKAVERISRAVWWQRLANAALLTLTAGATIDVLVRDERTSKVLGLLFSAAALFLAIFTLSTNSEKLLDQHRLAARALWLLREQYLHLIADIRAGAVEPSVTRSLRDALTEKAAEKYSAAPDTTPADYAAARRAIQQNEDLTFSQEELDLLLPPGLRTPH